MAFMKVNTDKEAVQDRSGAVFIRASGIYPVIIKKAIVDTAPSKAVAINLIIEHEGVEQTIYRAYPISNKDNSVNEIGQEGLNKLAVILGLEEIEDPVEETVPMGKDRKPVECMVLQQFDDAEVYLNIKMEYSIYNEEIQEKRIIRNAFRAEDKASAAEIVEDAEKGKQFSHEEKSTSRILKDGLTDEDVDAFISSGGNRNNKPQEKNKKPAGGFGTHKSRFSK